MYKAVLRDTGQEVAIKVQRPSVEPIIFRDLFIFRQLVRALPFSHLNLTLILLLTLTLTLGRVLQTCCKLLTHSVGLAGAVRDAVLDAEARLQCRADRR